MNAIQALMAAHAAGIEISAEGDSLVLVASAAPPEAVIALLAEHKPALLSFLTHESEAAASEQLRDAFEERAAISEHDGGLPRVHAEVLAAISVASARVPVDDRSVVIDAAARFLQQMLKK